MFTSLWSWLIPLLAAVAVFAGVLWTTPPAFGAILGVVFGSPRGPSADAAAYALGAAGSLALLALLGLALICGGIDFAVRRRG